MKNAAVTLTLRQTLIYAGVAALIAAIVQVIQIAQALSIHPIDSPGRWAISAIAGVVSGAALAALPWIETAMPKPPVPPVA